MGNASYGTGSRSYLDLAKQGQVYSAYAIVTAAAAYTATVGVGGPLLWNNSAAAGQRSVTAYLLALGIGVTTASTAAVALGVMGGIGQTSAPTSTTAIDLSGNTRLGAPPSQINAYRIGTVTNAASIFQPVYMIGTGALTVDNQDLSWTDLHGIVAIPPGSWGGVGASATATTSVISIGLVWVEIPN